MGTVSSVARRAGEGERRRGAAGRGGGGGGDRGREEGERRRRGRGGRGRREGKGERSAGREGERQGKPVKDLRTGAAAAALPAAPAESRPPPLRGTERCPRPRRCRPPPRAGSGRAPLPPPGEVPAEVPNAADGPGRQRCHPAASPEPRMLTSSPGPPELTAPLHWDLVGCLTVHAFASLPSLLWQTHGVKWDGVPHLGSLKCQGDWRPCTQRLKLTSRQSPGLTFLRASAGLWEKCDHLQKPETPFFSCKLGLVFCGISVSLFSNQLFM